MAETVPPRRAAMGARLRELRVRYFASGAEFARAAAEDSPDGSWQQSRVSKLERGAQLPTQDDLDTWVRVSRADPAVMAELRDMLAAARLSYRSMRDAWAPGQMAPSQAEVLAQDSAATRICEYQPAMVPGIAQTPAYAYELLTATAGPALLGATEAEIQAKLLAQSQRQQLLYTPGKRIQIVVGEAALYTRFGSTDALAGQLDRLIVVAGLATVTIGVLRFADPSPVLPLAGFVLNDASVVWVETLTGEQMLTDPAEVAVYAKVADAALGSAVKGAGAVEVIRAALERL